MLNREEEYDKMMLAEGKLWWYRILHEQVLETIQSCFSSKEISILDAGCGTGGLLDYLRTKGYTNIQGFDLSPFAVKACKERNLSNVAILDVHEISSAYLPERFDVIVCNDMLYFVEDEHWAETLKNLYSVIKPGGLLILNLPAFNIFQGTHDVSVGIRSRWTYRRFIQQVVASKLTLQSINYHYWPLLLSPLIVSVRVFQQTKIKLGLAKNIQSDVLLPNDFLNNLFYKLTKFELNLPIRKLFGSSLFVHLRKQERNSNNF